MDSQITNRKILEEVRSVARELRMKSINAKFIADGTIVARFRTTSLPNAGEFVRLDAERDDGLGGSWYEVESVDWHVTEDQQIADVNLVEFGDE